MGFNNGYESGYEDAKAESAQKIKALEMRIAELETSGGGSSGPVTPSVQMVYSSFANLADAGDTSGLPSGIYNAMSGYLNGLTAKPSDPYAINAEAFGTGGFYTSFIEIDIDGLMGPNAEFAPDIQVVFPNDASVLTIDTEGVISAQDGGHVTLFNAQIGERFVWRIFHAGPKLYIVTAPTY